MSTKDDIGLRLRKTGLSLIPSFDFRSSKGVKENLLYGIRPLLEVEKSSNPQEWPVGAGIDSTSFRSPINSTAVYTSDLLTPRLRAGQVPPAGLSGPTTKTGERT